MHYELTADHRVVATRSNNNQEMFPTTRLLLNNPFVCTQWHAIPEWPLAENVSQGESLARVYCEGSISVQPGNVANSDPLSGVRQSLRGWFTGMGIPDGLHWLIRLRFKFGMPPSELTISSDARPSSGKMTWRGQNQQLGIWHSWICPPYTNMYHRFNVDLRSWLEVWMDWDTKQD